MGNHDVTSSDSFMYDVFLSFRGGTRYAFTDHLYRALLRKGINTFRDNENLRQGYEIKSVVLEAIEKSRMAMVVLCDEYATSTWCLDELAKIIECYDHQGKQVLVVFYKVEPSDVRYQRNSYEKAMFNHELRFAHDPDKVKAWRSALTRVCDLCGEHCTDNMYESELIQKIVEDTYAKLPPMPLEIKRVVGLHSRAEQVKSLIDLDSSNAGVCMLGLYGVGGIGKTTFALYLYNKMRHQFEAASFLANIREKSNEGTHGLEDLQKILLSEMGEGDTQTMIGSTYKGSSEIKRRLGHRKVLLVLDDVDSVKQLESLAGGLDWFGPGSRIIITTRDTNVLYKHDVEIKTYKMEELNERDSLKLFCLYAFNMSTPAQDFLDISKCAISYAKGVPLALRVIGSNLKGADKEEWRMELEKYNKVPNSEIQGVLEISYHSLSELEKKIFLDIACFFKGERWEYVKRILEACDFYPIIRVFVNKCLITLDEIGCLEMHDLIQDMGREIVRKESPSSPGYRSRLWSHEDILKVLEENSGSKKIEGIMLHPPELKEIHCWNILAFKSMINLRILIVRNTRFSVGPTYLPNGLRLLDWEGYHSDSLPLGFHPNRIVDLNISRSCVTSLEKPFDKNFEDLTFINLSGCQFITEIPDMSRAGKLRTLTLDRCRKLIRLDKSIGFLPNLVYLSASECTLLETFVPKMFLPSLENLSIQFCSRLQHFPEVVEKMDRPLKIYMMETAIEHFPVSIGNLTGLEYINMSNCTKLRDLPSSFLVFPKLVTIKAIGCSQLGNSFQKWKVNHHSVENGFPNLKILSLHGAHLSDEDLHIILENFPKLEDLQIAGNDFVSLPQSIQRCSFLKSINVTGCKNLKEIPELPSTIQKVVAMDCPSLTSKASSMLWSKVSEETKRIEIVMPTKENIPEWFDHVSNEEIAHFWVRRKFPVFSIAFVFGGSKGIMPAQFVGLSFFIDGTEFRPKYYASFRVAENHVFLCDLRIFFNDEEWHGMDAVLVVGDEWKLVQVQCESNFTLSQWGIYVYKKKLETSMEDMIRFSPPPNCKHMTFSRGNSFWRMRELSSFNMAENFDDSVPAFFDMSFIMREMDILSKVAPGAIHALNMEETSASHYGASLKQENNLYFLEIIRRSSMVESILEKMIEAGFSLKVPKWEAQPWLEPIKSFWKEVNERFIPLLPREERPVIIKLMERIFQRVLQMSGVNSKL